MMAYIVAVLVFLTTLATLTALRYHAIARQLSQQISQLKSIMLQDLSEREKELAK